MKFYQPVTQPLETNSKDDLQWELIPTTIYDVRNPQFMQHYAPHWPHEPPRHVLYALSKAVGDTVGKAIR
jgi:hypothetical protein